MENNNKSCDDSSKMKKKIYHLDEINQKLLQTFRAIKKINKLFNIFASNLDGLNEMSKVLKPDAVNVRK